MQAALRYLTMNRQTFATLDELERVMVQAKYRLVAEFPVEGAYEIRLWQNTRSYAVTYGLQLAGRLDYGQASKELGECLLHALACAGKLLLEWD